MIQQAPKNYSLEETDIYVHPCVDGNSSTGEYFNFSLNFERCVQNLTGCNELNDQEGASIVSPILLSVTGIIGQICALVYLHRSTRPSSHRTTFYIMLTTLIWTDLFGEIVATPFPVYTYLRGHWTGGIQTCKIHGFSMSLIGLVIHLLVAAMALERYLGIRCGYFYNRNVTTSRARILLIGIWLFGIAYCSMPFLGIGKFKLHYPGTWCHIDQHICGDHPWPDIVFSNIYAGMNFCLLIITVICNLVVVGSLLKMRVAKYRPTNSDHQVSTTKRSHEREITMVILLVIITVSVVSSWAVHDVLMFRNQIWHPPPNWNPLLDVSAIRLVSFNQIIDPWSYIMCRMIFRSKIWKYCYRALIGEMNHRKFGTPTNEDSASPSMGAKVLPPSSHDYNQKITSSPCNSGGHESLEQDSLSQVMLVRSKNSYNHTLTSESDRECKIYLQGCIPSAKLQTNKRRNIFLDVFVKLFRKNPKGECYVSLQQPITIANNMDLPKLAPFTIPLEYPAFNSSAHTQSLTVASPLGRHQKRKTSSVSDLEETGNSNLHAMFATGIGASTNSNLRRSNSWCCPNAHTIGKRQKKI